MRSSPAVPKTLGRFSIASDAGLARENSGPESPVSLCSFGPDANPDAPQVGTYKIVQADGMPSA